MIRKELLLYNNWEGVGGGGIKRFSVPTAIFAVVRLGEGSFAVRPHNAGSNLSETNHSFIFAFFFFSPFLFTWNMNLDVFFLSLSFFFHFFIYNF